MTLTDLRYIVALAQERHFGHAAQKCFVAQPTLSVAVKKLEEELGVALFERAASEVRVTPMGLQVIEAARRVLAETARLQEIAAQGKDPLTGPLRLGVIYSIAPYLLPRLVPIMRQRAPAMPLFLREGYTEQLLAALKAGELDSIVIALPHDESGLLSQPVYDELFRVLLPAAHPWSKKKCIDPACLSSEPLLLLGAGNCFRDQVLDLCARADGEGQASAHILEGSSLETIRHMVASGIGITVMPASSVDNIACDDPLLCVKSFVEPQPSRRVGLVWRNSFPRQQAVDLVRQGLEACQLPGTRAIKSA